MATNVVVDGAPLLTRLNKLFTQDPDIDEIGLLFGIDAADLREDTAFILEQHKLGVAFSAGAVLFRAARTRFHELRASAKCKDIAIDALNDREEEEEEELLQCARAIVLISADFYTAWNVRKAAVVRGRLSLRQELAFTDLVFTLHPKSIDTWAYRRWLATRQCQALAHDAAASDAFFASQFEVCTVLTERYARNYHAWSFRHWLVARLDADQLACELERMKRWSESHLTDHSGWNHRQFTLRCLLQRSTRPAIAILADEYGFLSAILAQYAVHEALWCHRRFVLQALLQHIRGITGNAADKDTQEEEQEVEQLIARCEQVVSSGGDTSLSETESLAVQWTTLHAKLEKAARPSGQWVALHEIEMAWRSGYRFAQRYAIWVLQLLLCGSPSREQQGLALGTSAKTQDRLQQLDKAMRRTLETSDALLDQLWARSDAVTCSL